MCAEPVCARGAGERHTRLEHLRDRAWPDQTVADDLVLEHARLRLCAELEWHELVLDRLGRLTDDGARS